MALRLPTLTEGCSGIAVEYLQTLLISNGHPVSVTKSFDAATKAAVMAFQQSKGLQADGVVGELETWPALSLKQPDLTQSVSGLDIIDYPLQKDEYYHEIFPKKTIILHHTAGSHRPDYTIQGWEHDRNRYGGSLPVATAFLIGGKALSGSDGSHYDGVIYRAHPEQLWAHHLGLPIYTNDLLNAQAISIEICNYGPLTYHNGQFLTYVGTVVPPDNVIELKRPYKGFRFYQRYTAAQIAATKALILALSEAFEINVKGLYDERWFQLSTAALSGQPGLWTHTSYLNEKFDCFPQPELIDMLNEL